MLPLSVPLAEPTEEGESRGSKGESTAQEAALIAHGVLRPLYDSTECPACGHMMQQEAAYKCSKCQKIYHVRCMGHSASIGSRQLLYGTMCFLCTLRKSIKDTSGAPMLPEAPNSPKGEGGSKGSTGSDRQEDLIIDVMGVFD